MSYKAFISYSHAADGKLAPALQSALHRFAKPFYRLRAMRVFRDKTSLHLTPELWPMIQAAIGQSEWFILLASPDAAQSNWVQMEVGEWLKLRGGTGERLLIVQTEGEIGWDDAANDFDWSLTNALPPNLKGAFKREPFYSDLRWARTSTDVSLRNPQFLDDVGTLAAALHGKSKDEMIGNDIRQHRLFKSVAAVVGVLLLALAVGATFAAVYANRQQLKAEQQTKVAREQRGIAETQRRSAEEQRRVAEKAAKAEKTAREEEKRQRENADRAAAAEATARKIAEERRIQAERESRIAGSRELASSAVAQLPVDPELGVLLALEAHQRTPTAQSEDALRRSLIASHMRHTIRNGTWVDDAQFSGDGRWLVVGRGRSEVLEVGTWKEAAEFHDRKAHVLATFTPDGKSLVTHHRPLDGLRGVDHVLRILESGSWRPMGEWRRNVHGALEVLAVSPDRRLLFQWTFQKAVMSTLDDPATVLWTLDDFHARQAVLSPDGKFLVVTGGRDDGGRVLDPLAGSQLFDLGKMVWSNADVAFSRDGRYVTVAYWTGKVRVFDLPGAKEVAELTGHTSTVDAMAFSPDGRWLVTGSNDHTARVWDVGTWKTVAELNGHLDGIKGTAFSADGSVLVTSSDDTTARVWDVESWQTVAVLSGHTDPLIESPAVSPDGNYVATRSHDSTLRVWEVAGGRDMVELHGSPEIGGGAFFPLPFSPDGRLLVTRNPDFRTLDVRDTKTWRKVASLDAPTFLAFSPDGRSIFATNRDAVMSKWEVGTWRKSAELKGHAEKEILSVVFSPDGRWMITAGGRDKTARVWNASTGESAAVLSGHEGRVLRAAFSPDGKWLATTSSDNTVRITEAESWKPVAVLRGHEEDVRRATFSSDSRLLLTASGDRTSRIWEVGSWKPVAALPGEDALLSPDARRIVTTGSTAGLWDARSRKLVVAFPEDDEREDDFHHGPAFSADGTLLVTLASRFAYVWDATTGESIAVIEVMQPGRATHGGGRAATAAAFSPDGKWLLIAANDGFTRVFPRERFAPVDELVALAKTRATRALTDDERLRYLHEAAARASAGR